MSALIWIIVSTVVISLISLVGILTLLIKGKLFDKILFLLVALSAGALMGGAFLHLIPESLENFSNNSNIFLYVLLGFCLFFLIEKILHWRHCHKVNCSVHTFAYMNLFGEAVHNFIDGLIIAASFVLNFNLGITTSIAVALHEIPQEFGDFGVLVYGGMSKSRALLLNFLVALTAIVGGIFGYYLSNFMEGSIMFLLPFAAGGFIYIAASDLIPEIRKEGHLGKSLLTFSVFILGIILMYLAKVL